MLMLVTVSWMTENYNKYNELYWGGKLPKIELKINNAKKTWGYAAWKYSRISKELTPVSITMSNYYDSPENIKLTTLLHEMIHIADYTLNPEHFMWRGMKVRGYDAHGYWFKGEARRLSAFGWDIEKYVTEEEKSCSTLSERAQVIEDYKKDHAILCVISGSAGNWVLKSSTGYVKTILNAVKNVNWYRWIGEVKGITFYSFTDEKLALQRNAGKTLRGNKLSNLQLEVKLKNIGASRIRAYDMQAKTVVAAIAA